MSGAWKAAGEVVAAKLSWVSAAAIVLALNVVFALLLLWQATLPTEPLKERVRAAFASGDLIQEDWLPLDSRRGRHQYNDCLILKMLIHEGPVAEKAFAPVVHKEFNPNIHEDSHFQCQSLFELVQPSFNEEDLVQTRYSRYWHGYLPVSAAFLQIADLSEIRQLLKFAVYGALVVLVVAAGVQHVSLLAVAASVTAAGTLFWAVPYYGQSLCHGPGNAFVILGIAALLFWRERLARLNALIPFCAAYGAGAVYFEFLTGLLPIAAGLLFPVVYLIATTTAREKVPSSRGLIIAFAGLAAFAFGGLSTVVVKQVLSLMFVDRDALDGFAGHISIYLKMVSEEVRANILEKHSYIPERLLNNPVVVVLLPFASFLWYVDGLTHGVRSAGLLLYATSGLAWLAAGSLAIWRKNRRLQIDFVAFAVGAGIIPLWTLVLPTHTILHADFMVRIMIVPIALGWAALLWQLLAGREHLRSNSRLPTYEGSRSEGNV